MPMPREKEKSFANIRGRMMNAVGQTNKGIRSGLCNTDGCTKKTSESKPYCINCLGSLAYVSEVQKTIEAREKELTVAATKDGWKDINLDGTFCSDILTFLRVKAQSPDKLALLTDIPPAAMRGYIRALRAAGLLKVCQLKTPEDESSTTKLVLVLTDKGREVANAMWKTR